MFTNYFERHKHRIKAAYPKRTWPEVWNFGRVIRNAFAHNGCIRIDDAKENVSWRGLTYSHADNETFVELSLSPGDLIYLMFDMDAALPKYGG